jgi:hypothetical protein
MKSKQLVEKPVRRRKNCVAMPAKLGLDSSKIVSDFHFFGTERRCSIGLISTAFTISKMTF